MSVIIKGMEKPSNCVWIDEKGDGKRCPLLNIDDDCKVQRCTTRETWEEQMEDCPLIEIPKGAKLIDVRDVKKHMIPLDFSVQNWISEVDLDVRVPVFFEEDEK